MSSKDPPPKLAAPGEGGLLSRSFLALLATQFLVALNDNMFRWLIVPIGKDLMHDADTALALGGALFILPFVLLAAPAGYLADRCSKRAVIVSCKLAEIVIMTLGILAILSGDKYAMFGVLFLMGAQSAVFSPAKYGSIPEIVRHDRISAANGWIGMTTMSAVIVGAVAGGYLYDWTTLHEDELLPGQTTHLLAGQYRWWISASALIGVAVLGWIASLFMRRLSAANPQRTFPWNPAGQTYRDLAALFARRPLLLAAAGSAYFWSLGLLAQLNIDKFARPELVQDQQYVGYLLAILTLGIGLGSVLAGLWSRGHIEEGLVAIGAAGISVALLLLTTVPPGTGEPFSGPYLWAGLWLLMLGVSAGLYDIPLLAFMQDKSPRESRGRVLAAYNFLTFSGMLLTSGIFWVLAELLELRARPIFLVCSLTTMAAFVLIVWLIPLPTIRVIFSVLIRLLYRIRVRGLEHIPPQGGAVLVCNHVSWLDGLLLGYFCPRRIHLLADIQNLRAPFIRRIVRDGGVIQFAPDQRRSVIQAVRAVRELLQEGRLIGIFAEGGISRTGQIANFNAGFLTMLKGTDAPVIPVSLYGLWGSILSFEGGRFFTKWPRPPRLPISIDFGPPIYNPPDVQTVRLAVQRLATEASLRDRHQPVAPARQMLRTCRRGGRRIKIADSRGEQLSGPALLARALLVRRQLRAESSFEAGAAAGVLLPPSAAAVIANAAIALNRSIAVNVDPELPLETIARQFSTAGVRHVVTDRATRGELPPELPFVCHCLEDLEAQFTAGNRLVARLQAHLLPARVLEWILGLEKIRADDVFAILFTAADGSCPRGVQLTHRNIASNVQACGDALQVYGGETVLGVLPFWRADGFTLTLWSTLIREHAAVFHAGRGGVEQIAALCHQYSATVLPAEPRLLQGLVQAAEAEQLRWLRLVMSGPHLSPELAAEFESRFGVRPHAGYGATELSPVASVNVPPSRIPDGRGTAREGSVGWPLAGVTARVVDPDSGADVTSGEEGLLLIAGPNVMRGYLDQPEETARVLRDGWFQTGLRARIDQDGFLHLAETAGESDGDSADTAR